MRRELPLFLALSFIGLLISDIPLGISEYILGLHWALAYNISSTLHRHRARHGLAVLVVPALGLPGPGARAYPTKPLTRRSSRPRSDRGDAVAAAGERPVL